MKGSMSKTARNATSRMKPINMGASINNRTVNNRTRSRTQYACFAVQDSRDLLIVGPGVLGGLVASYWKEKHPTARIVGETRTKDNHEDLKALDIELRDREAGMNDDEKFPFVIFAAPPSGNDDYIAEISRASGKWNGEGTLLFTSSAAVYDVEEGECTENSPLKKQGQSERTDKLIGSEEAILQAGGCAVRLVGLYHAQRGAHTYFLKLQTVPRWGELIINLIHYEDAAELCCKILEGDPKSQKYFRSKVFLGTDGHPINFENMMDATLSSGKYRGTCKFVGEEGKTKGKLASNSATRSELGWQPKYSSFKSFMEEGALDFISETMTSVSE